GDLFVLPEYRRQGLARRLIDAAVGWSRARGCSGIYVTITPDGETRHRLSQFYRRLNFTSTGRTTMILTAAG
ncbi:MAG: GNAT family N-acetyltransferase, partial [Rhizobiales bacterium]|nr:GNAT family N-acetyltransferase [Hyphomicrobiales bacterium]